LAESGFSIVATTGTSACLARHGIAVKAIPKLSQGRPNISDMLKNGQLQLIINTPTKKGPATDEGKIRAMAVLNRVPIVTTVAGAHAAARAIRAMQSEQWKVKSLQAYMGERPGT
jgi:carbamoyl-phosphate synthase large subunit